LPPDRHGAGERKPWQRDRGGAGAERKPWQRDQRGPAGATGERKPWQGDRPEAPRAPRAKSENEEFEPRKRVEKPGNPTPGVPDERRVPLEPQRPQSPDRPPRPSENPEPFAPGDPERIRIIPGPPERAAGRAVHPPREAPVEGEDTSGGPAPAHKTKMPRLRKK